MSPSSGAWMPAVISDSEVKVNAFLPFQIRYSIKRPEELPVTLHIGSMVPSLPINLVPRNVWVDTASAVLRHNMASYEIRSAYNSPHGGELDHPSQLFPGWGLPVGN